ncbi:MAG: heterodisulfide reductase-related iron-sulfur binding cluster [Pirellulaceae bacterium]|nr:4Fe-4S dicluster domain-containing protein [Planctomycetales bacterium]
MAHTTILTSSSTIAAAIPQWTREIFGNIPESGQIVFYVAAVVALGVFAWGMRKHWESWTIGSGSHTGRGAKSSSAPWPVMGQRLIREVLLQRRVLGRGVASIAHLLLFSGFVVLLIGTTLIAIEHVLAWLVGRPPTMPVFHYGWYFLIYEFMLDTFGVAFLIGVFLFFHRRWVRSTSLGHTAGDWLVLVAFLTIALTGFAVEGLRILHSNTPLPGVSFAGWLTARTMQQVGVTQENAGTFHLTLWWVHAICALAIIAAFPYTRLMHALAGMVNIALQPRQLGALQPLSIEDVEQTGRVGVSQLVDLQFYQLVALDACVECGRCTDACPAHEAGKPLNPKTVVQDIKRYRDDIMPQYKKNLSTSQSLAEFWDKSRPLCGDLAGTNLIDDATLWSCTTCGACVDVCPLRVNPLEYITDMRRHLVANGALRGSASQALQRSGRSGNPWGLPTAERFAWAEGLDVPTVDTHPDFEILYWVGCAAAYDRRIQKVARSVVRLLRAANVSFAVLGPAEKCTGETARRMGDEFLFQELAASNMATLAQHRVRRIVTHCPHCLNSLRQDYSQFGGNYDVVHHTQFLQELLAGGRLKLTAGASHTIAYHDPCYLARAQDETEAPRALLSGNGTNGVAAGTFIELARSRRQTACCGGGGGRMWFDDAVDQRAGRSRAREVVDSGAETLAVACPFCLIMMTDGLKAQDSAVEVRDIAELLCERLEGA